MLCTLPVSCLNNMAARFLSLSEDLWDMLDKQVLSMKAPPPNLKDLKDLLLMSF